MARNQRTASWIRGLFTRKPHKASRIPSPHRPATRPGLEALEDRTLLSAVPASLGTLTTDQADYHPEQTVTLSGDGFQANADLFVQVIRPDGSIVHGDGSFTPGVDTVTTGPDGSFTFSYQLDGITGTYVVDVLDANGSVLSETTFTDSTTTPA